MSIFEVLSGVQKDLGYVSAGIGILKKLKYLIGFHLILGQSQQGQL
jgi:hypothetical protein